MPIRPDLQQLEKCIDDALRKNDFKPLKTLLQIAVCKDVKIKCSKQFFFKLDDLICRELEKRDLQNVSAILVSVGRCSKNISILGQSGLLTMIKQGLVQKMVSWFEKLKEIIRNQGNSKDGALISMIEDFFDILMLVNDVSDEGKRQIVENFTPRICALVIDSRVNICIQHETLKRMNTILEKIPQDSRKVLSNQEILSLMNSMGERIIDAGDYDLQVCIIESLCRMTTKIQRQELAYEWFSMDFIANAFKGIKDSEFETDCRLFLNLVNGMLGDKRRVFTFPCVSAFLDSYELQIPSDEKLEEFWIDFNLGSQSLSFYVAGDNDEHHWEAVAVPEEMVLLYSIEVRESKTLLTIILKNIITISKREGKELLLYFDESLEIANVTKKIFGANKYREFTRKQGISVAKTSVHILFDASGSQILVPESQVSPIEEEPTSLKEKPGLPTELAKPSNYIKNVNQEDRETSQLQVITPSKRKMSEASMIVPSRDRYTVRSPLLLINTSTPRRRRTKPPLQMMSSAEQAGVSKSLENGANNAMPLKPKPSEERRRDKSADKLMKTAKIVEKDNESTNQSFNEFQDNDSDSQAVVKRDKAVLPCESDSVCEDKAHSKLACWTPVENIQVHSKKRAKISSEDIQSQDHVIHKNMTKQKPSSSISGDNSEEIGRMQSTKEIVTSNTVDKLEVEMCGRSNQQHLNHHKNLEEKSTEHVKQRDWHIESQTTFKSVLLNKRVEESLIYRKKYILSKDLNTTVCDKTSSGKNLRSHRKSEKRQTSELNSCDLKQKNMKENSKGRQFSDAAESLINQINRRYKAKEDIKSTGQLKESVIDNEFSSRCDLQLSKEKVQKKSFRQLKTTLVNVTSKCPLTDIYNFNLNGADEPTIKLGVQEFQATNRETCVDNSGKLVDVRNRDKLESPLKTKDKSIITNYKKKHLFSDDETEYRDDDSRTDISWLRAPKSKPQLIDYSRNKNVKRHQSGKPRSSMERGQPGYKVIPSKTTTRKVNEIVPDGRTRLPRKAAETKKNYKDLSNSESESELEFSQPFKEKLLEKEENIHSRSKCISLPRKPQDALSAEIPKELQKEQEHSPPQGTGGYTGPDASPVSSPGTLSSIEVMRGIEKTARDFTQDFDCITKSTSPSLQNSSLESLNSKNGDESSRESSQSKEKHLLCRRERCSPVQYPLFLSTSTAVTGNTSVTRKDTHSVTLTQEIQNCSTYSDVSSFNSEKQVVENELPDTSESFSERKEENHLTSSSPTSSERQQKLWYNMSWDTAHVSGPTQHPTHKRMYFEDNLKISEEVEMEEEDEGRATLLPTKLSKFEATAHHTFKTYQLYIPENSWEFEYSSVGVINDKLKKKIQTNHRRMDSFTQKSWKTAQQHIIAMNHQIHEHRNEKLEKFQFSLIQELENFERESQSLKNLEKEIMEFGEKICKKLSVLQKSEKQRLQLLRASYEKNVKHNKENEEDIFTSEMCLMREKMKRLQDQMLKEMQEEELLHVRRGLVSLIMPNDQDANI
ncbi:PREDICTED: synaptonemal complex protein 2 [Elephantulus edwardii]|uniref:synaptonemal complex protein 2 n=1 Tax=Elephantulus edwardii TaxID=28737 RepID=UPI0003F0B2FE|nr:PREDICTED: synaptonemal complex protein 2 [Elephantulus edwardii]